MKENEKESIREIWKRQYKGYHKRDSMRDNIRRIVLRLDSFPSYFNYCLILRTELTKIK